MPTEAEINAFLQDASWADAVRSTLAGDASHRRYERLTRAGETAVLMIAPPETGERTAPFVRVATHLNGLGLSAPEILANDPAKGLLLLEDLGDDLFARVTERDLDVEPEIYQAAIDALVHLHDQPVPEWADPYDVEELGRLAGLAFEWYAGHSAPSDVCDALRRLFDATSDLTGVLVLRDYHAENLLWLPDRSGLQRTGLLDFQDAMAGHRAYDLVSLIEDARRDLTPGLGERLIEYYVEQTGVSDAVFRRDYSVMGTQRNLRILGVFARLAIRDGKPGYLNLIPRVWGHLQTDLSHPALSHLRELIGTNLPGPDGPHLNQLRSKCAPTR